MVKRHTYPTDVPGTEIAVATESMKDGKWSVVSTIEQQVGDGIQAVPMPVTHMRFETEEAARAYGLAQGQEHLARMTPAA
jgi:hypothetical protein